MLERFLGRRPADSSPRVLVLADNLWISGPGRATVTLCNELVRAGCTVRLHGMLGLSGRFLGRLDPAVVADGDEDVADSITMATETIEKWKPDAVMVNYSPSGLALTMGRKLEGRLPCPVGLFVRAPYLWTELLSHPATISTVDGFLAVSDEIHNWLVDAVGIPEAKVHRVPNLVDCETFSPVEDKPDDGTITALYLGRISPEKHPSLIVKAYRQVASTDPRLRLIMVGGPDSTARGRVSEYHKAMATELARVEHECVECSADGVEVPWRIDATDDVVPWLHKADVLVLASEFEGTPNVLLEAMACGVPVIAPAVGQCKELIHPGDEPSRGLVYSTNMIEPDDGVTGGLAASLSVFIAMGAEKRKQIQNQARRYVEACFSTQAHGASYIRDVLTGIGAEALCARLRAVDAQGGSQPTPGPDRSATGRWRGSLGGKPTYTITGGAGFIGGTLARHLVRTGHRVIVVDDLSTGRLSNLDGLGSGLTFEQLDIADPRSRSVLADAIGRSDGVFHLAAMTSVPRSFRDPDRCHAVNVGGTMEVLAHAGHRRVVMASSSSVYGLTPTPQQEDQAKEGIQLSPYAQAKWTGDVAVREAGGVALRFFNVYGPHQLDDSPYTGVIALWCRALLDGEPVTICGDGMQSRAFVFVTDVVAALVAAMTNEAASGQAFNVGAPVASSLWEVFRVLSDHVQSGSEVVMVPPRKGDIRNSLPDLARIGDVLAWHPRVTLAEGLRTTLRWYSRGGR